MKTIGEIRCNIDNLKTEPNLVEDVRSDLAGIIDMLEKQRLISIAQTKLEEACMFTIKALYAK
nr:MAG TPA: hypothetical protein [Caudoviricetes sp.]